MILKSAGARYEIVTYPGAKQKEYDGKQFDMPGDEYNADADKDSWNETLAFLARVMQ